MPTLYEKVVDLVVRPPTQRTDFQCQELVSWFRNKAKIFHNVKPDIVKYVIKYCDFERKHCDDVIIKQGERGDKLYVCLKGKVSIYVIHDKDNESDVIQQVESAYAKKKLDRALLGQYVWTSGEGQAFGEVALIKEDCIRTASVVADEDTDLLVVDRNLYNRSVRDVMEREFNEKTEFVEKNPLFSTWTVKQRRYLSISFKKETVHYGCPITRQGQPASQISFILTGEVEIQLDPKAYETQFPNWWAEMKTVLPELVHEGDKTVVRPPHEQLHHRRRAHKPRQICLLGENEHIGALEMVLGLEDCIETATATGTCEFLVLRKDQYDRLFRRKYATQSVNKLKDDLANRLCLYILKTSVAEGSFLRYLNMKLEDPSILRTLKENKSYSSPRRQRQIRNKMAVDKTRNETIAEVLKRLHMRSDMATSLPADDMSEVAISNMNGRLRTWREKTGLVLTNGTTPATIKNKYTYMENDIAEHES
ncbi:uncharacterized protein LOC121370722 [Gigantopelta aegis]|uniref:uncharacterized protein LOC121370722 n=1 Tax=Gigantopelta aegis TaxID=1735272 RepID=UPI001B88744F|nr:uncharacterized protein LOC121370722 [Gigantopelta aegis]